MEQITKIRRNSRTEKVRRPPIRTVSNSRTTPRPAPPTVGKLHIFMFIGLVVSALAASYYWIFAREMNSPNSTMNANNNLRAHKSAATLSPVGPSEMESSSKTNEGATPRSPVTTNVVKTTVASVKAPATIAESHLPSQNSNTTRTAKATIAYLTSVTACPVEQRQSFIDAAAVLKHSIHLTSMQNPESISQYDYHMYAFVHPNASACAEPLREIGYRVQMRDCPVALAEVQNDKYRARLANPKAGCCQEKEFLKLYSYTMQEYNLVVHLDIDFLMLRPMDDLFDAFFESDEETKEIPHAMWPNDRRWKGRIEAMFTRDYPMSQPGREVAQVGMQGGFFIVRPNQTAFDELVHLVRQGNFNAGWYAHTPDGERVKYPGFYGAAMIQGLIGFYYGHYHPGQVVELNRCYHNNMADRPRASNSKCFSPVDDDCMDCRHKKITDIYSVHFTFCQKPWTCPNLTEFGPTTGKMCKEFHEAWHRVRHDFEQSRGVAKDYEAGDHSFGHCPMANQYVAMEL
eukprot:scaffold381_cov178-Amphora_coffeaeformis.AAC.13